MRLPDLWRLFIRDIGRNENRCASSGGGKFVITLLVGALIVMVLPIINGGAIIFFDTPSYLEQATKVAGMLFPTDSSIDVAASLQEQGSAFGSPQSDNVVTSGRSLYYGLFMYAGWITSLWVPIAIQALVLSWLVLLLFNLGVASSMAL